MHPCAKLTIGHFNNARRLNGPVSIGDEGYDRLINIDRTSTMSIVGIARERLFIQIT